MVLVISHAADDHARAVLAELARRAHPAVLLDTAHYPARASLSHAIGKAAASAIYTTADGPVDLTACRAAWWRRPQGFTLHEGLAPAVVSFTYSECHEAVHGCLAALTATWVNPPEKDERAHHKPLQLELARQLGLQVPETLISNDPAAVRRFVAESGESGVIFKTFLADEANWRETRMVTPGDLELLDTLRFAPAIFQRFVPAEADLRVTIVGDTIFTTEVRSAPGAYAVDYRMDLAGADYRPGRLPAAVERRLQALMRSLGLVYGAADFRRTPAGEYVFLEVNPAGEWLFIEERSGQPITQAMAALLVRLDGEVPVETTRSQGRRARINRPAAVDRPAARRARGGVRRGRLAG